MRLPISKRLLLCGELAAVCDTAADVGTDHGYLGIYLLRTGKCRHVIASDLREKPLASARSNAGLFGVADRMTFLQADGLEKLGPSSAQVIVCAGMGGDLIARILFEAAWLADSDVQLILQPQSAAHELRRALGERGWAITRERLVRDGGFLYSVMSVLPKGGRALTPGEQYVSPALRQENDPLYYEYLTRMRRALELTVTGITQSKDAGDLTRAAYYQAALEEALALERSF